MPKGYSKTGVRVRRKPTVFDRFDDYVDRSGGPNACWPWLAGRACGYGVVQVAGKQQKTHRLAFEKHHGPIPAGMFVCHSCDNPPCVNPAHLFLGSPKDNIEDMMQKGRQARGHRTNTAKLRAEQVLEIRRRYEGGELQQVLADEFGISNQLVSAIVLRQVWKHV